MSFHRIDHRPGLMRYVLIFLVLLIQVPQIASAQPRKAKKPRPGSKKERELQASQQIFKLKEGTLLLRLHTRKPTIEALKKIGKIQEAAQLEYKVQQEHKQVMNAFSRYFDFCKTAFFYSESSLLVTERKFDQVLINGIADTASLRTLDYFLVAEFGNVSQDSMKRFSNYSLERSGTQPLEKVANYHGGQNLGMNALVILSDQFIQLRAPFPYYARFFKVLPYKMAVKKAVRKLNRKLHRYYLEQTAGVHP